MGVGALVIVIESPYKYLFLIYTHNMLVYIYIYTMFICMYVYIQYIINHNYIRVYICAYLYTLCFLNSDRNGLK